MLKNKTLLEDFDLVEKLDSENASTYVGGNYSLFRSINSLRQSPLSYSLQAFNLVSNHNQYMCAQESLSHDGFNARMSQLGASAAAENVAFVTKGVNVIGRILKQWWSSTPHRQNMLNPDYTRGAVATLECGNRVYGTYIGFNT